jgi:drug/metabolite transporter (DMT)-like permease
MRIRKKYLFYVLATVSAAFVAASASFDKVISEKYVDNPWVLCLSFFIAGLVLTCALMAVLSVPAGRRSIGGRIDPSFRRIRLLRREEVPLQLIAGLGNAVTTIGYYFVVSMLTDSSTVLAFSQMVILYLLAIESFGEKNTPTLAEVQSALIVTCGALLASISLAGGVNVEALVVVLLVVNPGWVLFASYQRKLKLLRIDERPNDALNIRFYNLLFSTLFVLLLLLVYDPRLLAESIDTIGTIPALLFVNAFFTFFSIVLFIRAMGIGKASTTQAVRTSAIIFAIPFTLLIAYFVPGITFESDPTVLAIKFIGLLLVIMGVISYALTEVKAFIFIRLESGHTSSDVLQAVWHIKGITNATVVGGSYDIIAKARMRTLGKGYENIIRALEGIRGIEKFSWQTILKEWEEI